MASEEDADELKPYNLFTLTDLISKKATQSRNVVLATTEVRFVTAVWYFTSLALSILAAVVLGFLFMGKYAALIPIFLPILVTAFATTRSRAGLQLTHISRLMDKLDRPWARGMLVYAGRLYDPMHVRVVTVTPATVEVAALPGWESPKHAAITGVDAEEEIDAREQRMLASGGSGMMVSSARGDADRQSQMRSSMMDVVREEESVQWARSWEAHERYRREWMLQELAMATEGHDAEEGVEAGPAREEARV